MRNWRSSSRARCSKRVFSPTGIGFPTVAKGKARVRTIVSSEHTRAELDRALEVVSQRGQEAPRSNELMQLFSPSLDEPARAMSTILDRGSLLFACVAALVATAGGEPDAAHRLLHAAVRAGGVFMCRGYWCWGL